MRCAIRCCSPAACFLMLYVGSEMAAGAWTAVYLQQSAGMDEARSAAATSLFWAR